MVAPGGGVVARRGGGMHGIRRDTEIRSKSGRYASYWNAFLFKTGGLETRAEEELTPEMIKKQMTDAEWQKIYEMSQDKNLYHHLCTSLFPTIHG